MNEKLDIDVKTLKPFTKFIYTIGELPTSYLISMTYEEQLIWLCNYLTNTVIPTINNNAEAVKEVQDLVTQLQNYINNYFDNLDVQQEINNKLDSLVENGTLTTLIGNYINPLIEEQNNEIQTFKNTVNTEINNINAKVNAIEDIKPIPVSSVSDMTDTSQIYVNTTDGYWYYYNGSEWVQGAIYQSTGINNLSISHNLIKPKNISKDKLNKYNNLLELATEVYQNKAITGYNTTDGITLYDNIGTNVLIFDLSQLHNEIIFNIDKTKTTDNTYNLFYVLYDSANLETYYNRSYNNLLNDTKSYDTNTKQAFIHTLKETYNRLAITVNETFDIYYDNENEYNIKTGDDIFLQATNMLEKGTISKYYGFGGVSNNTPIYTNERKLNTIIFPLNEKNINYLKESYLYCINDNIGLNNRIILYTPNQSNKMYALSHMLQSSSYDSNTKRLYIGTYLGNNINLYDYIAIAYEHNENETSLYSLYVDDENLNYNLYKDNANAQIILPNKFKMVQNQKMCFYYQNCTRYANTDNFAIKNITNSNISNNRLSYFNKSATGNYNCTYQIKNNNQLNNVSNLYSKNFEIEVLDKNVGQGLTKKVLFIGDSLTQNGIYGQRILDLFNDDVMNVEFIGTRGTGNNKNEGRSGWSTSTYANEQSDEYFTNPFYNPSTQHFDFTYYMTQNNFTNVDYVFINLGTNDRGHNQNDIINNLTLMINSIKNYDNNIKIGLWLPPTRGITSDVDVSILNELFDTLQINKLFIDTYLSSNDVYLIPVYTNVNPYDDYTIEKIDISDNNTYYVDYSSNKVHPKETGYYHIGDVLYAWIKYFASLNN